MSVFEHSSPCSRRQFWRGFFVALCVGVYAATPAAADGPGPSDGHSVPVANCAGLPQVGTAGGAALMAGWVDSFTGLFEGMTGNRARVIQFTVIAMLLALWVIWWRK